MKVPIAEVFDSIQGEGQWVGTPMRFVRLAGCSVGKFITGHLTKDKEGVEPSYVRGLDSAPRLATGNPAWLCQTVDGRPFWCDTDFAKYEEKEPEDLFFGMNQAHLCITGGEPLIHHDILNSLFELGVQRGKRLHIETSGTIPIWWDTDSIYAPWLTVSPKKGALGEVVTAADEVKILVSPGVRIELMPPAIRNHPNVYLSPINDAMGIDKEMVAHALELLKTWPHFKLSVQLHKYLGVR